MFFKLIIRENESKTVISRSTNIKHRMAFTWSTIKQQYFQLPCFYCHEQPLHAHLSPDKESLNSEIFKQSLKMAVLMKKGTLIK